MNDKLKAARSDGSTTDGVEADQLGEADRSEEQSITDYEREQDRPVGPVELFLVTTGAVGETNAITSRRIKEALGYADIRSFRSALEGERQRGAVICGGSRGIYVPQDGDAGIPELEQYIRTTRARIGGMFSGLGSAVADLHRRRHADQIALDELTEEGGS